MTLVESDEAKRTSQLWILLLELAHHSKRLDRIDEVCEYPAVSIIDKEKTVHP